MFPFHRTPAARVLLTLTIALFIGCTHALKDTGRVIYRTEIGTKCAPTTIGACCFRSPPCSIGYFLRAVWTTEIDGNPTEDACKKQCSRHLKKCRFACTCLAETNQVSSSDVCKCTRNADIPQVFVRNNCIRRCFDAQRGCVRRCTKGKKCPIAATTKIGWFQTFAGKCSEKCARTRPICPLEVQPQSRLTA